MQKFNAGFYISKGMQVEGLLWKPLDILQSLGGEKEKAD